MGEKRMEDRAFAEAALKELPSVAVPSALQARILADFDAVAAKHAPQASQAPGALAQRLRRWRDALWPGAPLWKPASVLALSLLIGLSAGALMPASTSAAPSEQTLAALDATPVLDLSGDL
jgi:hypothetical protein